MGCGEGARGDDWNSASLPHKKLLHNLFYILNFYIRLLLENHWPHGSSLFLARAKEITTRMYHYLHCQHPVGLGRGPGSYNCRLGSDAHARVTWCCFLPSPFPVTSWVSWEGKCNFKWELAIHGGLRGHKKFFISSNYFPLSSLLLQNTCCLEN